MDLTKFTGDLNNIQSLPNKPALSAEDLKKAFDEGTNAIKEYLNTVLITELISILNELEKGIESGESSVTTINNTIAAMKSKLDGIAEGANKYVHPTTAGNKHIPSGGSSGQILRWKDNGEAQWGADNNTTYGVATTSTNGLMSATDKTKLNGIATGANNYSHPTSAGNKHIPSGGASGQVLKYKANGEAQWANEKDTTYSNATTSTSGLMSATDKTKLNGIAEGANKYTHPTTSGNKHIPAGGSSGQILRWSSDGTAAWGTDNNTTYGVATTSANGLMSSSDKTKLNGIATGATKVVLSRGTAAPSGGSNGDYYIQHF